MYFTSIPDHHDPAFDEQLHFSRFKQHNIIFNAMSYKSFCERHVGCLSIKRVLGGEEWYGVDRRQLVVRPGQFLILNDDQEYACRIDTAGEVRVQSVFFSGAFASAVFRDALLGEAALLDDPFEARGQPLEFFQAIHDTDHVLEQKLTHLMGDLDNHGYSRDRVDEQLVFLLSQLVCLYKKEVSNKKQVSAVKANTRSEIYRRLCIARDLLHSSFMEKPDLAEISSIACLSTPQLIRQFKAVFQTTPHQYLIRLRLKHAASLLKDPAMPVHEITWKCGFENTSAFCRAFKAAYGVTPQHYRMGS
jgi:AraC family transcriptional regulator